MGGARLTAALREALEALVGLQELKEALEGMSRGKTPGSDGNPEDLYQKMSKPLLNKVLKVFDKAKIFGRIPLAALKRTLDTPEKRCRDCGDRHSGQSLRRAAWPHEEPDSVAPAPRMEVELKRGQNPRAG
ncbi:hypothetical protein NDU88_002909 [Pleurodeles waltl]|uniref:Uncharacterized protein n=1 Tax=Pleurodeles waltl TaxID=8319 RepID=A0AAV7NGN1_PLEWA|nr:hypothetical protein NDU88_002909 [Pleurodeles waltl]